MLGCYPTCNSIAKGMPMSTCLLTKPITKHHTKLSKQLETIQEDLSRLSWFVYQLSDLTGEQLETLDIAVQLDAIHRCLTRFETYCMAIKIATYEDDFAAPVVGETELGNPKSTSDWNTVRREAKRANKLANQLTESLSKIRADLSENQNPGGIPEDIIRINQTVGNAVNGFVSDGLLEHG